MSSLPNQISILTLGARDLPRLREFYWAWGWETNPEFDSDTYASFVLDGMGLSLHPMEMLGLEAAPGEALPEEDRWNGITLAMNVESKERVDTVIGEAVAAGAEPISPPTERVWGGYSGYIADPESNRWEIAWSPHTHPVGTG